MLEKPALSDDHIITCLYNAYQLVIDSLTFLPLGADLNTVVYRAVANDEMIYFVKLRSGPFNPASVAVPKFLSDCGLKQIIPPLPTQTGQLWAALGDYRLILYPFVVGHNAFEIALSEQQRREFGAAMKAFHTAHIPPALTDTVPRERFSPHWRNAVKHYLARCLHEIFDDPIVQELAVFLSSKHAETLDLVMRAEQLACDLQSQKLAVILCHADIHGWNLLITDDGALYMVDWDTLIFAPKERDLMFVGSGLGGHGQTQQAEIALFYEGYGAVQRNETALAYYRYERIIEDIAVFCEHIFASADPVVDRLQSLAYLKANFLPNQTIELAYRSDMTLNAH